MLVPKNKITHLSVPLEVAGMVWELPAMWHWGSSVDSLWLKRLYDGGFLDVISCSSKFAHSPVRL